MTARPREAEQTLHLQLDGDVSGDHDQLRAPLIASSPVHRDQSRHHDLEEARVTGSTSSLLRRHARPSRSPDAVASDVSRILDRDAGFHQSRGRWRVQHLSQDTARQHISSGDTRQRLTLITKRLWDNWFYTLAYQRTIVLMAILFVSYATIVFLFACVYLGASKLGQKQQTNPDGTKTLLPFCDMDIHLFMEALYFSLSTMTTIGYGVSDYYFGGCYTPLILVLCQVCCAITFDAVAIGLIFQRISRGQKRAKTIVFSNQAVVQRVGGVMHLMFRVGELRHHQLRDARVRAYCVRHERHVCAAANVNSHGEDPSGARAGSNARNVETTHYVTRSLKLMHEEVCSDVLMSLPQVIVHRMDSKSPLSQPSSWYDVNGVKHEETESTDHRIDQYTRHRERTQDFLSDREAEIVVLVEGTDELTGAIIQARHSYTTSDLAWDHVFVPCVFPNPQYSHQANGERNQSQILHESSSSLNVRETRSFCCCFGKRRTKKPVCFVDFGSFHDTVPAIPSAESSPYVFPID
mmetsp:Transcript_18110/g.49398  ORF Transcript_18110/g.49398 Transcript_18110/m.49398 type:complete len:522 (-) Transcript_18110:31-1596(-)